MNLKILLLNDHPLFADGLTLLIEKSFPNSEVRKFRSPAELVSSELIPREFHLLISDVELGDENVISLLHNFKLKFEIPVLIISIHKKLSYLNLAKKLGIEGFIFKKDDINLSQAIASILKGDTFYSASLLKVLEGAKKNQVTISKREVEIIQLILLGFKNQEIAAKLFLSVETIKTHKRNIKIKLGIKTNRDLISYANSYLL